MRLGWGSLLYALVSVFGNAVLAVLSKRSLLKAAEGQRCCCFINYSDSLVAIPILDSVPSAAFALPSSI